MGAGSREIIYVMDKGKEYACKIVERNEKGQKIKVHFVGWNKKCDIWLDEDSDRIVPSPNDRSLMESESMIDERVKELESCAGGIGASKRKRVVEDDEERSSSKRRPSTAQETPLEANDASVPIVGEAQAGVGVVE